jgi:hypothetical protein
MCGVLLLVRWAEPLPGLDVIPATHGFGTLPGKIPDGRVPLQPLDETGALDPLVSRLDVVLPAVVFVHAFAPVLALAAYRRLAVQCESAHHIPSTARDVSIDAGAERPRRPLRLSAVRGARLTRSARLAAALAHLDPEPDHPDGQRGGDDGQDAHRPPAYPRPGPVGERDDENDRDPHDRVRDRPDVRALVGVGPALRRCGRAACIGLGASARYVPAVDAHAMRPLPRRPVRTTALELPRYRNSDTAQ